MNNFYKQKLLLAILIIFILTASGCGFAPKEEALPEAPVIPTGNVQQYKKVEVLRGDIIENITIDCTYMAFQVEKLMFHINGLHINHVYVEEGDYVKAGDVLADLEMGDLFRQIEERSSDIELLNKKLSNEKELRELSISTREMLKNIEGYNSQIASQYMLEIETHDDAIAGLTNDLFIAQERLKQLNEDANKRQIIAGIDGIVSNITNYDNWYVSDKEAKFITVYDPNTMVFITDEKNSDLFQSDQKVNITVTGMEYNAVVISPEELINLKVPVPNNSSVYLKVDDLQGRLQNNDKGEITFILNELKDVLYLPSSAVQKENDKTFVFIEDKGGFKSIKEVETGLTIGRKVEIKSGLNEGDSVILD